MIHDPLCEYDEIMFANEKLIIGECSCEVIARARADERKRMQNYVEHDKYCYWSDPVNTPWFEGDNCYECQRIAQAREDERNSILAAFNREI